MGNEQKKTHTLLKFDRNRNLELVELKIFSFQWPLWPQKICSATHPCCHPEPGQKDGKFSKSCLTAKPNKRASRFESVSQIKCNDASFMCMYIYIMHFWISCLQSAVSNPFFSESYCFHAHRLHICRWSKKASLAPPPQGSSQTYQVGTSWIATLSHTKICFPLLPYPKKCKRQKGQGCPLSGFDGVSFLQMVSHQFLLGMFGRYRFSLFPFFEQPSKGGKAEQKTSKPAVRRAP